MTYITVNLQMFALGIMSLFRVVADLPMMIGVTALGYLPN